MFLLAAIGSVFFWYFFIFKKADSSDVDEISEETYVEVGPVKKIIEIDDARVASDDSFSLAFPVSGKIEKIYKHEGKFVFEGDEIVKLETTELELQSKILQTKLLAAQANLDKLYAGAVEEYRNLVDEELSGAKYGLAEASKGVVNAIQALANQIDDAVRGKTDELFSGPRSSNPQLLVTIGNSDLENDIEGGRAELESDMDDIVDMAESIKTSDDLEKKTSKARKITENTQEYLTKLASLINQLSVSGELTQDLIDRYKSEVSLARTQVNTAVASLGLVMEDYSELEVDRKVAKSKLYLVEANPRVEDITIAQAGIDEISIQIDILNNHIKDSTIKASKAGFLKKIFFDEQEIIPEGVPEVILESVDLYVEADIPEENISKIDSGVIATVKFEAIGGKQFKGEVELIEPYAIEKDGDVFYRSHVRIDDLDSGVRVGMTAEVSIESLEDISSLRIPIGYVIDRGSKSFVIVSKGLVREEVEIEKGIEDEGFIQVQGGQISEGDKIIFPKI